MNRKLIPVVLLLILVVVFAACSGEQGNSSEESLQPDTSSRLDESSVPSVEDLSSMPVQVADRDIYVQQVPAGSDAAELELREDGTFVLRPVMYDGLPEITGTYQDTPDAFVLQPEATTAHNITVEELGIITMTKTADGLLYSGIPVGDTMEGSAFVAQA